MFNMPWEDGKKPYFTNEEGVEWYIDKSSTEWAHREDLSGTSLKNLICFFIKKDENWTRGIMDSETNLLIYENTGMEAIAVRIDMLKTLKRFDKV